MTWQIRFPSFVRGSSGMGSEVELILEILMNGCKDVRARVYDRRRGSIRALRSERSRKPVWTISLSSYLGASGQLISQVKEELNPTGVLYLPVKSRVRDPRVAFPLKEREMECVCSDSVAFRKTLARRGSSGPLRSDSGVHKINPAPFIHMRQ